MILELLTSMAPPLEALTLAQVPVDTLVEKGVTNISKITILLAVAGISYGGYMVTRGEVSQGILAIVGALILAFAYPLAASAFELAN